MNVVKKQSTGFMLRTFLAILVAFCLMLVVLVAMARPVMRTPDMMTHMSVDWVQDMLNASVKGMTEGEIRNYLASLEEPAFQDADVIPNSLTIPQLEIRYGVHLFEFEENCILNREAVVVGDRRFHRKDDASSLKSGKHFDEQQNSWFPSLRGIGEWLLMEAQPPRRPKDGVSGEGDGRMAFGSADLRRGNDRRPDGFVRPSEGVCFAAGQCISFRPHPPRPGEFDPPYALVRRPAGDRQPRFERPPGPPELAGMRGKNLNERALFEARVKPDRRPMTRASYLFVPLVEQDLLVVAHFTQDDRPLIAPQSIVVGAVLSLLIMMLTALFLILPTILRLHRYELICKRVSHGDFHARCDEKRNDTLGVLAHHIDEMTTANLNHFEQQKSLLQAVAHEMRTPLSRIRFSLEMLNIAEDDEKSLARLDSIDEDLTEVDSLIKELSYFNYVDAGNGRQHFEENDVGRMIDMTIDKAAPSLQKFAVSVEGLTDDMTIEADATAFRRVIGNLIGNAVRYAKEKITIRVRLDGAMLEVAVEDDGPGIPVESRQEVFEPFASVDKARNKAHSGFGLGLAIASRIMKVHEGSITIEDSELGGCRMVTKWPVKHSVS